jgi:uncharacterized membrane protein
MGAGISRAIGSGRFAALPLRGGGDAGVSVLAIVLRFTIWVLAILAAVWIAREILAAVQRARAAAPRRVSPALAELDMLYARGEVTRTEYLARRADLAGVVPPAPPG